jgi:hypothetical protein
MTLTSSRPALNAGLFKVQGSQVAGSVRWTRDRLSDAYRRDWFQTYGRPCSHRGDGGVVSEGVWEAARSVRFFLPSMLGPVAEEVDKELAEILTEARESRDGEARLREVLGGRDETKAFLRAVLADEPHYRPPQRRRDDVRSPGFGPLPGQPEPPPPPRFRCPLGNDFTWYRLSVAAAVPECPTHGCLLVQD